MAIDFPAHVCAEGLGNCVGFLAQIHGYMMFKAHLADVLHEVLEIRYLHHAVAAERFELVVCEFALACIGTDNAGDIVRGCSAEGCLVGGYLADDGAIGVFLADGAGDNLLIVHPGTFEE